jgi:hypothetical protein
LGVMYLGVVGDGDDGFGTVVTLNRDLFGF